MGTPRPSASPGAMGGCQPQASASPGRSHAIHVNEQTGQLEVSIGHIRYGVIPGSAAEQDILQGQNFLPAHPHGYPQKGESAPKPPASPGLANQIIGERLGLNSHFGGQVRQGPRARPSSRRPSPPCLPAVGVETEMGFVFKKPQVPARFQGHDFSHIVSGIEAVFEDPPALAHDPNNNPDEANDPEPAADVPRPETRAELPSILAANESPGPAYQCQVCLKTTTDQKHFFFHLKEHYEPRHEAPKTPTPEADVEPLGLADNASSTLVQIRDDASRAASSESVEPDESPSGSFPCRTCRKNFSSRGSLVIHTRIHNEERPFTCQTCQKSFRQRSDLGYHQQSLHSEKKMFGCDFCPKEFSRKYSLTLHRKIHTNERNHVCGVCQKAFRAAIYLTVHQRAHTGEKPYDCDHCEKSFRTRSDMRRHQSNVHDKVAKK